MATRNLLKNPHLGAVLGIILAGAFMRLVPHAPNFAPVGALALFSGFHLTGYKAYLIPFGVMILSDIFLGFHATIFFVYVSFLITLLIGRFASSRKVAPQGLKLVGMSLMCSAIFFLITNWGVWYVMDLYPETMSGLMQSYVMALPFFRNTLLSDLMYNVVFFYGVIWLERFLSAQVRNQKKLKHVVTN